MTPRVVYDCMVFLQALARKAGPAGACLDLVVGGAVELVVSPDILAEVRRVVARPHLQRTFLRTTDEDIAAFLTRVETVALVVDPVPSVFSLQRDPKDSIYLNLAIAAGARLVVSRDNDLLDLMTGSDPDAVAFRAGWPDIAVLDPVSFLRTLTPPAGP